MAFLVEVFVVVAGIFALRFWRDDWRLARSLERFDHAFAGIEGLIGDHGSGFDGRKERIGAIQIMGLAGREQKVRRIAESIDGSVNFGAQSTSRAADRLVFARFF